MTSSRRLPVLCTAALRIAALCIAAACATAHAAWPEKPVKVVIGFPAGGPLDAHMRLMSDRLAAALGQSVIIDYKSGAGGAVGADAVAKSAPDGYTLLLANTGTMVINPAVYPRLSYSTLRDFAPVARTAQQPLLLIVNPAVPARTLPEFIAHARANPGKINFGSAGNGGISHLVPEMLKQAAGISMTHVPYKGSAPAFVDLMAGQVQFMAESVPQAAQYAKQGKVRALAVTSRERNVALPDTPTMAEAGIRNFEVVGFYGILAPAATPRDVVERLSGAFRQVLEDGALRERMVQQGADPAFLGAGDFLAYLKAETPRWAAAVAASGTRLD
jgi:tripartite-type tricarboxylate transporter receptor subunit TctC